MTPDQDITRILASAAGGGDMVTRLLPLVYEQLRAQADAMIGGRERDRVDPTSIVHEAFLKLVAQDRASYSSRVHFMAVAAVAMRRLLVDRARRAQRRTKADRVLGDALQDDLPTEDGAIDLIDLDAALMALAEAEPRCAGLVELRFFGGLTMAEAAEHLSVSLPTAERDWRYARAWLYRRLEVR